ncbi:protease IV [Rhodotorula toruloides]|uniref:Protease IV n=1 Tax=Rhodotorula toruloides TaxID=5286 RepID=A0A511KN14_RHOTO|nr:protease IV [Rhodotorula toruloides]
MDESGPAEQPPQPRPATPGVAAHSAPSGSLAWRIGSSRGYRYAQTAWRWKGLVLGGVAVTYAAVSWNAEKAKARKRDTVHPNTYLYWKIYDGGIVEAKSAGSNLNYLLSSSQRGAPEEPPRVMELFEVIRTIKFIENDDRIKGIIADFSHTSIPSVPSYNLGLAQLEEIQDALLELRRVKQERFGQNKWRTVAWTDTFTSQGQYLLASTFDEVYCQPTGEVPLVGLGSTTPFFGRLARWLGIEVHAEARREYKSFVQPYIDEKFTDPQRENTHQLLSDLNDNFLAYIGRNRFSDKSGIESLEHVKALTQVGPFSAAQAKEKGLIDGLCYRQDVLDSVLLGKKEKEAEKVKEAEQEGAVFKAVKEAAKEEKPVNKLMGFYHYHKVLEKAVEKHLAKETIPIGVVYLQGTIGDVGEFGTASVVRGLKEAGEDDTIGAVVLRIDSGGGSVIDSDTIWGAVRDLREKYGKTVVASFGNSSASGGYWVSTHTDAILAAPSTVTGSIGVAALRPTFLQSFFDRLHISLESFFTGSRAQDPTHSLTPAELERYRKSVDAMYDDFKRRVCEGRDISPEVIESIAGGRVMTGLRAFEINAPKELIEHLKGLDIPAAEGAEVAASEKDELPKIQEVEVSASGHGVAELTEAVAVATNGAVATMPEEQETSPFAVPEVAPTPELAAPVASMPSLSSASSAATDATTATVSAEFPSESDPAAVHAQQALLTSTPEEQAPLGSRVKPKKGASPVGAVNGAAGEYEYEPGPYGRGLIDGLGGLRDAAVYACQLFIANGIAGYKEENPGVSDDEAIRTLLPDAKFAIMEDGEVAMQVDVTLKRFPVQKSFWQQLAEASRRGDSLGDSVQALFSPTLAALRTATAKWFLGAVADSVVDELNAAANGAGVRGTATPGLGRGARWTGLVAGEKRAEYAPGARWV